MEHVTDDCTCQGKQCTKCQQPQCIGNYAKDKRLKSGLKSQCKICTNKESKGWREKNHEYNSSRRKVWYHKNIERARQLRREYQRKTATRRNELAKQSRARKYGQVRARERAYNLQNREQAKEQRQIKWKKYYYQNKQRMSKRAMDYFHAHPGYRASVQAARRARKTQAGGFYTVEDWEALKVEYDYRCLRCGKREPEIKLTADHVIPIIKGGTSDISNIQPLCKPCNSSKGQKTLDFRPKTP